MAKSSSTHLVCMVSFGCALASSAFAQSLPPEIGNEWTKAFAKIVPVSLPKLFSPRNGNGPARQPIAFDDDPQSLLDGAANGATVILPPLNAAFLPPGGLKLTNKTNVKVRGGPIYGSITTTQWVVVPITDSVYSRFPSAVRANIWRGRPNTGVPDLGIFGGVFGTNNETTASTSYPAELLFDGSPQQLCRYPNADSSWLQVAAGTADGATMTMGPAEIARVNAYSVASRASMLVSGFPTKAQYWYFQVGGFYNSGNFAFASALPKDIDNTGRYRLENVPEELDQPGEYYIDRVTGYLYWYPTVAMNAANMAKIELTYFSSGPLLTLSNCTGCEVNITAGQTRNGGIAIIGGTNNQIADSVVKSTGIWGIKLSGGTGNKVLATQVIDAGETGIGLIAGDRTTATRPTSGNGLISGCTIVRPARIYKTYKGGILLGGVGNTVETTTIEDCWGAGIHFQGFPDQNNQYYCAVNDITIQNCTFKDLCKQVYDAGAIYQWNTITSRGNLIKGCQFININNYRKEVGKVGVACVYFDGAPGWTVDSCTFSGNDTGVQTNGGRQIVVKNSTFNAGLEFGIVINGYYVIDPAYINLYNARRACIEQWSTLSQEVTLSSTASSGSKSLAVLPLSKPIWDRAWVRIGNWAIQIAGDHQPGRRSLATVDPIGNYTGGQNIANGTKGYVNGTLYREYGKGELIFTAQWPTWGTHVPSNQPSYTGYADLAGLGNLPMDHYRFPAGNMISGNNFATAIAESKRIFKGAYWAQIAPYVSIIQNKFGVSLD